MSKKILSVLLSFIVLMPCFSFMANAYSAVSYCLYDPVLKKVLASSNMNNKMAMASTTKIMTALIACEICDLDKEIEITDKMIAVEGSSIGVQVGDVISYKCLLYGLMLESGNDAALCIAIGISGSAESFAVLMNKKAEKIGLKNTNFVTANGLDDKNHYSTAFDMAKLGGFAMQNEIFSKIVGTKEYKAVYNNGENFRTYYNHNRLLSVLDGAEGIKTGFTKKAGRCLVSSCRRNGVRLIAVTLKAYDDWNDHKRLYDFGFKQYQNITLPKVNKYLKIAGRQYIEIKVESEEKSIYFYDGLYSYIDTKIYLPRFLYSPVNKGDIVGHIEYIYNKSVIATANIKSLENVKIKRVKTDKNKIIFLKTIALMLSIK